MSGMVWNQVYYHAYHIYSNPQNDGKVKFQSQDNMETFRSFGGSQSPNRDLDKTHWNKNHRSDWIEIMSAYSF